MTANETVWRYMNTGSLQAFLLAIVWGLAAAGLFRVGGTISMLVLVLSGVVYLLRHQAAWIAPVLGVLVGVLLFALAGLALPEGVLLVVIFGACLF